MNVERQESEKRRIGESMNEKLFLRFSPSPIPRFFIIAFEADC
jgi:hypothetical protein